MPEKNIISSHDFDNMVTFMLRDDFIVSGIADDNAVIPEATFARYILSHYQQSGNKK